MKSHWSLIHHHAGRCEPTWEAVLLQTFFRGNSLRYFTGPSGLARGREPLSGKGGAVVQDAKSLLRHLITSTSTTLANGVGMLDDVDQIVSMSSSDLFQHNLIHHSRAVPALTTMHIRTKTLDTTPSTPLHAQTVIWQEVIPQLAQDSVFLMYGVLACSALHLAYLEPEHRQIYRIQAARYQELAMPPFRAAVAHLDGANCHATLAFIHLLAIHSFAFEQEDERLLVVDPNSPNVVSDWLSFLRSGCDYVGLVWEYVENGPLKALLCEWTKPVDKYQNLPHSPLVERLMSVVPPSNGEDAWSEGERRMYRDAVFKLGYAFLAAEKLGGDFGIWDALRVWPVILEATYFEYLRVLHPGALIVLAHYCRLLHRLDGKWYLKGRADRLLTQILQRLDTHWHPYIDFTLDGSLAEAK